MKLTDVKEGDIIIADGGFTCMEAGEHKVYDDGRFYIKCDEGKHFLEGQEDENGNLIGVTK